MSIKYKVDDSGQIIRENYQSSNDYSSSDEQLEVETINGTELLTIEQIRAEVSKGAKLVAYSYVISILVISLKNYRAVHLVRTGESIFSKMFGTFLVTFLLGWWGIPWGIIWTIGSLYNNLTGGTNLTEEIMNSLDED